jgi:hypothetical protein
MKPGKTAADLGCEACRTEDCQGLPEGWIRGVTLDLEEEMKPSSTRAPAVDREDIQPGGPERIKRGGKRSGLIGKMKQQGRLVVARGGVEGGS